MKQAYIIAQFVIWIIVTILFILAITLLAFGGLTYSFSLKVEDNAIQSMILWFIWINWIFSKQVKVKW